MRLSHFRTLMVDEFGAGYAASLAADLVLSPLGGTAEQALAAGVDPGEVWAAICDAKDVPAERRLGVDRRRPPPRGHRPG
jgi:hypothetical protein